MGEKLKIGVIGTSWWADIIYLPILQAHERANMVAICGRNRERADEMAQKYEIPEVYTDYREMVQSADLDAIIVATPDDTHCEMVMAGLDKDLHILCEKPTALNTEDARKMYEKAEEKGVKHMVMYTWHWLPHLQRVKQLIHDQYLGKVYHGHIHWLGDHGLSTDYKWRFDADHSNGVLADVGSHLIHMAMWLLGEVTAVTATLGYHIERKNTDDTPLKPVNDSAILTLEFANGTQVQCSASAVAHGIKEEVAPLMRLDGEKGTVNIGWNLAPETTLTVRAQQIDQKSDIDETITFGFDGFFKSNPIATRLFVDSILDDKLISPGLYEGYQVQRVIDAALESHHTGRKVLLST